MQRFLVPALAVGVIAGGAWLAPHPAIAQSTGQSRSYNQNGATAWGDPWLNENDYDYNRRHWLPSDNNGRNQSYDSRSWDQNQQSSNRNNWSGNQGYDQNWNGNQGYQGYGQYQNTPGPNQGNYGQGNYGQGGYRQDGYRQDGRNWNGQGYDNRYGSRYPGNNEYRGSYNAQPGYGRSPPPYTGPGYNDDDEE